MKVVGNTIEELGLSKEESERMPYRLPRGITQGNEQNGRAHDPIIVRFGAMMDRDTHDSLCSLTIYVAMKEDPRKGPQSKTATKMAWPLPGGNPPFRCYCKDSAVSKA